MRKHRSGFRIAVSGLALLASAIAWSQSRPPKDASNVSWHAGQMSSAERQAASELFQEANQDRAANQLSALQQDSALTQAAWQHAQRMVRAGTLSHDLPGEPDLIVRVQQAGVRCSTVDENLAEAPTADAINKEWMHSPPHRANLLDPRVNSVGIAVVKVGDELYAVQDFAREVKSLTRPQQEQQVSFLLMQRGLQMLPDSGLARSYCGNSPDRKRPLPRLVMKYSTSDLTLLPQQVKQGIAAGTFHRADVGACSESAQNGFTAYQVVILLY